MSTASERPIDPVVFWGKLGRTREVAPGFHPLICHMLDVAAVTRAMWDTVLGGAAKEAITLGLGMEDATEARDWVTFLAGAHDLGKCSAAFIFRREAAALARLYDGLPAWNGSAADAHHGVVTARELPDLLVSRFSVAKPVAQRLALVTGGHHGIFPSGDRMSGLPGDAVGRGPWRPQQAAVLDAFASVWAPPAGIVPQRIDNATAILVAGLISVADWIGSDEDEFRYAFDRSDGDLTLDLAAYAKSAVEKAERALSKHGWAGWRQHEESRPFAELFPDIPGPPRPLQVAAIDLAEEMAPGIVVIESPMGEGKTEAALYLADRWGMKPGPRGLYVALPTQATSNQMFTRVCKFLAARYPEERVNIQLLHGHAALSAEYELLRREGERLFTPRDVDPEDSEGGVGAAAWFAGSKRGLLAAFGVGTIDQGLLAILQTKHVFVRHFGLAHRVVVIDEVHAYDTYMSALLERLLTWLAALGSPVVLLSATLPAERRRRLLDAYARGLGAAAVHEEQADYPRITSLSGERSAAPVPVRARHVPASDRSRRVIRLVWRPEMALDTPAGRAALGAALMARLAQGGCAAVICNTVARAQAVYRALKPLFSEMGNDGQLTVRTASDGEPELDLFHARFVFEERQRREERALRRFGKPGEGVVRPARAVLVATQVIEQSLDLDFDLLVTDLAPADLVLQRAGRLHRHTRPRSPGLEAPEVWVCAPPVPEGVPEFGAGNTAVYHEHVLLRTSLALKDRETFPQPDDNEA
ncbi:MAG: CRISPR-associated helicase Cas3' [Dehalococcoidia bacterium]